METTAGESVIGIPNFLWHLERQLATGAEPKDPNQIQWLATKGIKAMVSLVNVPDTIIEAAKAVGIKHVVLTRAEAGVTVLELFKDFLDQCRIAKEPVFVHCKNGTVASVMMVRSYRAQNTQTQ